MKKSLTIVTLLAGAVGAYSQGLVQWEAYSAGGGSTLPVSVEVYAPSPSAPGTQVYGNGANDVPAGTQTYTGALIGGSGTGATSPTDYANGNLWSVQLYGNGGSGDAASTLVAVPGATETFATSAGDAGEWNAPASSASIPNSTAGGPVTVQLDVWYNGGGTLTYAQAAAAGDPVGVSPIMTLTSGAPPATPPTLAGGGLTSFSLMQTPEPSTIALGIIGASSFLLRRRKA